MTFLLRISAIFACFAVIAIPLSQLGNPDGPAWTAWKNFPEKTHGLDFAVIGDSRAHTGISPTVISRTLGGLKGYNFGVDGTDAIHHSSFAGNALLKAEPPPRFIVWAVNPLQFDERRLNNRLEQLVPADLVTLWKAGAPQEIMLDVLTMAFFKPWRHRPAVAEKISDYTERAGKRSLPVQRIFFGLNVQPEPVDREYNEQPDGQVPFKILLWKDRFERAARVYEGDYEALRLSSWHLEMARELGKQARARGVTLIMVETPVAPWFNAHLAKSAKHLEWRTRISKIAAEAGAVFWNHSGLFASDELFGDPGHMPAETAARYSEILAQDLKDAMKDFSMKGDAR